VSTLLRALTHKCAREDLLVIFDDVDTDAGEWDALSAMEPSAIQRNDRESARAGAVLWRPASAIT